MVELIRKAGATVVAIGSLVHLKDAHFETGDVPYYSLFFVSTIGLEAGTPSQHEVTELLKQWRSGDKDALEKLTPLVYDELHRLAHQYVRRERPDHTLQTTAPVNEAYLRLVEQKTVENRPYEIGCSRRDRALSCGRELVRSHNGGKPMIATTMTRNQKSARLMLGLGLFFVCTFLARGNLASTYQQPLRSSFENSYRPSLTIEGRQVQAETSGLIKDSLCSNGERVMFSAMVRGSNKLVSLCSSKQLTDSQGYLQYRFGRPGKVELEFPKNREATQSGFRYSRYTRPLVTYVVLRFETGGYLYSIHQNNNAEEKPALNEATVTVTPLETVKTDSKTVEIRLRMPVKGSLMNLEDVVRKTDEEPTVP